MNAKLSEMNPKLSFYWQQNKIINCKDIQIRTPGQNNESISE